MRWIATLIVAILLLAYPVSYRLSAEDVEIKVTDRERVEDQYLIFTNQGVFKVTDSLLFLTWNASDRYNELVPDQTFTVTRVGWRVPLFSAYPNIISVK